MLDKRVFVCTLFLLFCLPLYILGAAIASEKSSEEIYKDFGVQKFNGPVKAPAFTMMSLGGQEIKSQDLLGKVVLLTFFTID